MKPKLRAHHLLCLQGFQGYGYDADFVENMSKINEIRKKDVKVAICDSPDDICIACPNLKDNICVNIKENENIVKMDRKVIAKLPKTEFESSKELFKLVQSIFTSKDSIKGICDSCKWTDKCLFVQSLQTNKLI